MSQPLKTLFKLGGMLTILFSATTYSPAKASAQSLLPDINVLEGGQICLALCTSPRSVTPSQGISPLSSQGLSSLPSQVLQLPGQVLQLPQQVLSSQSSQVMRSGVPVPPSNPSMIPGNVPVMPGNVPAVVPGNLPVAPQSTHPVSGQKPRTSFIQKIAPVLPVVVQQLSR